MRQKLLFLLTALLLLTTGNAWGQITETYDFEAWGKAHMNRGYAVMGTEPAGFSVGVTAMRQLHVTSNKNTDSWDMGSRIAVSPDVTFRWGNGSNDVPRLGTENANGTFYISIFGLNAGDVITFTVGGTVTFYSSNATYDVSGTPTAVVAGTTPITGGTDYTITGSGAQRLDLTMAKGWNNITKIVITRNPYKSWNFQSLSPSWNSASGFGSSTININGRSCTYTTGSLEGMALDNSNTNWLANGNGLLEGNGDRSVAILDLKANDRVVIVTSTTLSALVNATSINDTYTGTCEFRVTTDGAIGFTTSRWTNSSGAITSLKVYHEYVSSPIISKGRYYLKNKSTGAYFAGGQTWGTQAITNSIGHVLAFNLMPAVGSYYFNTFLSNGGDNHYLNGLWCDGTAVGWNFVDEGDGYYSINDGTNKLTAGAVGELVTLTSGTGDNTKWKLLTEAEWKAENVARLDAATSSNGVDATFYIPAANFGRNDNDENAKWQGSPEIAGLDGAGVVSNYNAQKINNPFATWDVYQNLTGLKPGAYKVTVQGFNRYGLDNVENVNDQSAILYANTNSVPLKNIRYYGYTNSTHSEEGFTTNKSGYYVPNNQTDAAKTFNADYYNNELFFVVGNDGALRIGVKKDVGIDDDWTCFDNFQLTYYGNSVSATLGANGYATFASPYALDLTAANLPSGLKAYKAQAVNSTYVHFEEFDQTVPANTGILFEGTASKTYNIPVVASGDDVSENAFEVNATGAEFSPAANTKYYALIKNSNPMAFGWFDPSTVAIPANKAFIPVANGTQARLVISFCEEEDPTAINAIEATEAENGALKDGKYLIEGKIVLVKNGVKYSANGQKLN